MFIFSGDFSTLSSFDLSFFSIEDFFADFGLFSFLFCSLLINVLSTKDTCTDVFIDSLLSFIHLYTGQRDRLLFYKTEIFPLVSDGTVRLETVVSSD